MNILIVGLGSIAAKHIQAISNNEIEAKIMALRHSKDASVIPGVINIFSFNDLKDQVDFIIISNPTSEHYNTIQKCISLNCPLFIEKPLFSKPEDFETLNKLVNDKGIKTYVACVLRFHPVVKFLKNNLKNLGTVINEVNIYCGSYLPEWRPGVDYRTIYSAQKAMGGGVHLDLIHEIDYAIYLFGKPNRIKKTFRANSSLKIDAYDYANYCLIYDTFVINVVLNYYRIDPKREIEILFNDKTITGDLLKFRIQDNKGDIIFSSNLDIQQLYDEQIHYFCNNDFTMNNIEEAWEILKIIFE